MAFLGDSYAFGMGVEDGDTIPVYLQRLLERDGRPELEYEVLNFGVPGYSTRDESLYAGARLPAFGADALVLLYSWNDPELHPINFVHDCYHRPSWWEGSWALQLLDGLTHPEYPAAFRTLHDPGSDAWRSVEQGFLRIGEVARVLDAPVLLVILPEMSQPTWEGYEYRPIHAQIGDAGRAAGMRVADLLDDAPAHAPHPYDMVLGYDGHTNPAANAGIAWVVERELARMRPELFAPPPGD